MRHHTSVGCLLVCSRNKVATGQHMLRPLSDNQSISVMCSLIQTNSLIASQEKTKPFVNKSIYIHSPDPTCPTGNRWVGAVLLLYIPVSQILTSVCILGYNYSECQSMMPSPAAQPEGTWPQFSNAGGGYTVILLGWVQPVQCLEYAA